MKTLKQSKTMKKKELEAMINNTIAIKQETGVDLLPLQMQKSKESNNISKSIF